MNTLTKIAAIPALALATMVPLASAVSAGEKSDDIVVISASEMRVWQADATRTLNLALSRNPLERSAVPGSGIVQVTFALDADGTPTNLEIYSSSADWVAERSAIYAVQRLGDLRDVPVTNPEGALFIANIVFAEDAREQRALLRSLEEMESQRLASRSAESQLISLGG